jgi:hypothetical protein
LPILIFLTLVIPNASATHVGLIIENTSLSPSISENNGGGLFYNLTNEITLDPGSVAVNGGLFTSDMVENGKRAVVMLGFTTDLVLLDALAPQEILINSNEPPVPVQFFTLRFFSNPNGHGLDPLVLLAGYDEKNIKIISKTLGNTCPVSNIDSICAGTPSGFYDLTSVIGNYPDTLRIAVHSDILPISEPCTDLLLGIGLLSFGLVKRNRLNFLMAQRIL